MEVVRFRLAPGHSCAALVPASDGAHCRLPLPPLPQFAVSRRRSRVLGHSHRVLSWIHVSQPRRRDAAVCMVLSKDEHEAPSSAEEEEEETLDVGVNGNAEPVASSSSAFQLAASVASSVDDEKAVSDKKRIDRAMRREAQRSAYLWAAIVSSIGFTTLAAGAVYYRFVWQLEGTGEVPFAEVLGTFSLAVGAAVGMEFWARWAHKALWHASLWSMHESHHRPREGPFELNDVFAIINAVPAIALMAYGFFKPGLVPGLCFGAGLGITMFGMAYMFIHDGLVHRRFPVGPLADVPYFKKVAAAHQLHHADLFQGVPYGLFLGPKELEMVGGLPELEALMESKKRFAKQSQQPRSN